MMKGEIIVLAGHGYAKNTGGQCGRLDITSCRCNRLTGFKFGDLYLCPEHAATCALDKALETGACKRCIWELAKGEIIELGGHLYAENTGLRCGRLDIGPDQCDERAGFEFGDLYLCFEHAATYALDKALETGACKRLCVQEKA